MDGDSLGAYGLRIGGLDGARAWMQPQSPDAPHLRIHARAASPDLRPSRIDADAADLRLLGGGRLRARRGERAVTYDLPAVPPDEDLLHPYLAPAAALVWRWAGREALHAGAFAGPTGAIVVLGDRMAGKSTTLEWLSRAGVSIVADDLAVIESGRVLAGPRSIDLRDSQASDLTTVRGGDRRRATLPGAPASAPLKGVALLEWGPHAEVSSIPLEKRWATFAAHRMYPGLDVDPVSLLRLVTVPALRFVRPRSRASLEGVGQALLEMLE